MFHRSRHRISCRSCTIIARARRLTFRYLAHKGDGTLKAPEEAAGSCGVYLEQPNPLGVLDEGLVSVKDIIGDHTALIVGVQPVSLGVVEAPGHYGADIVVGEGQPLGSPITGGGPLYGIFACTKPYLRLMPGRIVGRSASMRTEKRRTA